MPDETKVLPDANVPGATSGDASLSAVALDAVSGGKAPAPAVMKADADTQNKLAQALKA